MAGGRLTIEQVAAPDLTQASQILANSARSFDAGMESAKGLLGTYQTGQQAKGDKALTQLLAGASSEEELNKLLATTDISNMNISEKMRESYLGARGVVLGYGQTRASTDNTVASTESTRASTSRANAAEGRAAADWTDSNAVRDEMRGLTGAVVDAEVAGRRYGTGTTAPNTREVLAATLMAEAGGEGYDGMVATGAVIRNRADSGKYGGNDINGVIMKPGQFSAWNGVTGYAGGEGAIDMANLNVSDEAYAAADAILSGNYEDITGGATHYYNPSVATPKWGESNPDSGSWTRVGNHIFGSPDGGGGKSSSGPVQGYTPGQTSQYGGSAAEVLAGNLRASTKLTPDQAIPLLQGAFAAEGIGQAEIDAANAKRTQEILAASEIAALQDPLVLSQGGVQGAVLNAGGVSAVDRLAAAEAAGGRVTSGATSEILSPSVTQDPTIPLAIAAQTEDAATAQSSEQGRLLVEAQEMKDPVDYIIGKTGIEASTENRVDLERMIDRVASNQGISRQEAAIAINKGFISSDTWGSDPVADMFDLEVTGRYANDFFSEEAKKSSQNERTAENLTTARMEANALKVDSLSRQLQKETDPTKRDAIQAQINSLTDSIVAEQDPQKARQDLTTYIGEKGLTSALEAARMSSDKNAFPAMLKRIREMIEVDENMTDQQKRILISTLRG